VLAVPIGHDVSCNALSELENIRLGVKGHTLESQLSLEQSIERLAILACVRIVDPLVRAHHRNTPGMHGILERPKIQFVHGLVVNVG
jgi:hypothetical protein